MAKQKLTSLLFGLMLSLNASAQFDTSYWYGFSVDSPPKPADHSAWQAFLDRYRSALGRIGYAAVTDAHQAELDNYIRYLQSIDPRYFSYDQQLAYWLNLHNATTVQLVLDHAASELAELDRIGDHRQQKLLQVAGVGLSLDDIVKGIVLPIWQAPEVIFLLACPTLHCPPIPEHALTEAGVQQALQQAPAIFATAPGAIEFRDDGTLLLAQTFADYQAALSDPAQLLRRVAFMADDRTALRLLGYQGEVEFRQNTRIVAP